MFVGHHDGIPQKQEIDAHLGWRQREIVHGLQHRANTMAEAVLIRDQLNLGRTCT
jgi:hypothetical protein